MKSILHMANPAHMNQFYKLLFFSIVLITCFTSCNKEPEVIDSYIGNYIGNYIGVTHETQETWTSGYPIKISLDSTYSDTVSVQNLGKDSILIQFAGYSWEFKNNPSNKYYYPYSTYTYWEPSFYSSDSLVISGQSGTGYSSGYSLNFKDFKGKKL